MIILTVSLYCEKDYCWLWILTILLMIERIFKSLVYLILHANISAYEGNGKITLWREMTFNCKSLKSVTYNSPIYTCRHLLDVKVLDNSFCSISIYIR
jgi:hypothetical protein